MAYTGPAAGGSDLLLLLPSTVHIYGADPPAAVLIRIISDQADNCFPCLKNFSRTQNSRYAEFYLRREYIRYVFYYLYRIYFLMFYTFGSKPRAAV